MAVFVARELWLRRALTPAPPQATAARPIELKPEWRTFPHAPTQPIRTETSVTSVAPIKLTRMQRRGKTSVVPVPKPD